VVQVVGEDVVVVGSQRLPNPGPVPIAFNVPLNADLFDPTATAQLWAIVVDGNDAWVTPEGVAVATNGAPSDGIVVRLTFRPDALEGQVTGFTVGAGSDLSGEAVSMTWVLNATTLAIVGFDSRLVAGADPIPFAVPFSVTNLDEGAAYVAESFVYDGAATWTTVDGTPVITQGNPISDVTVTVSAITPFPSASPAAATPTPAPTASVAPVPPPDSGGGFNILWLLLALIVIGVVVAIIILMRRNQEEESEPTGDDAGSGTGQHGGGESGGAGG